MTEVLKESDDQVTLFCKDELLDSLKVDKVAIHKPKMVHMTLRKDGQDIGNVDLHEWQEMLNEGKLESTILVEFLETNQKEGLRQKLEKPHFSGKSEKFTIKFADLGTMTGTFEIDFIDEDINDGDDVFRLCISSQGTVKFKQS